MTGGNTSPQSSEIPPNELRLAFALGTADWVQQTQTWQDELLAQRAIEEKNYDEAARLLEPLAARGSAWAQRNQLWVDEWRAEAAVEAGDEETGARLLASLAARGSQWAVDRQISRDEHQAWRLTRARNYERARPLLESLAERGSPWAMNQLGRLHRDGKFGTPDLHNAIALFDKAVCVGHVPAYKCLGCAHLRKGDYESARIAFITGAELGHKGSMVMAGLMLVFEPRGETDTQTGLAWLNHAAYGTNGQATVREYPRTGLGCLRLGSRAIWLALVAATRSRLDRNYYRVS